MSATVAPGYAVKKGGLVMTAGGAVEKDFSAICGLYWKGSAWYDVLDATCATQGEANLGKLCPVYSCAREHRVEHCGLCPEFPCILLVHMASLHNDDRIPSAATRAEIGNELWASWAREQRLWTTAFCPLRTAT
jgi:hypothetical protein